MSHVLRNASVRLVAMLLSRSLPWTSLLVLLCLIATPALAVTYSDNGDGTVTDPTTGLTWMRCAMGQTWDGSTCTGTGSTYTWDQANALTGTVTFAGQSDWRVPNIRELQTIVDRSTYMPAIDSAAFPNTSPARFWSASDDSFYDQNKDFMPDYGWGVDFHYASMYGDLKDSVNQVRLVRSGQSSALLNVARPTSDYVDHGDGTVTHTPTGLMWKRCAEGQTWQASNCNGTATTFTWDAAIAATDAFAGKSDWRLPTVDELLSLVDYTTHKYSFNGAINETIFRDVYPGSPGGTGMFWSASEYANNSAYAWYVNLGADGGDGAGKKSDTPHRNVFLVRAGFGTFDLTVTKTGSGTISAPARINCGNTCTADFGKGFAVALTAAPTGNFIGWGGACSGTGATCTVTMNAAQNVTANFKVAPIVVALPANLSFANQNLGTTSAAQTVTLSNTGGAPFNLSSIVASGDFAVTHDCGTGLGAGGFCALNITFTPTVAGTRNGSVTITDDAFDSPQTVSLTGLGQGPTALLNALSITFPNQGLEIASAAQIITLTNTGGGVLNISSILVSGDFARTTTCGATLISGANCTISVTFTPTAVGARIGSLVITSDVASSPNTINLSGTGGAVPVVSLDSMSLTFATENMGTSSAVKTVALTNTGGATLNLASIGASGDYTAQNNCGAGLVAGGSCSISITFTPTLVGARGGSITITSNAVGSPHTVSLSGIGTISLTLGQGWNLLGNGVDQVVSVSSLFGDPFAVTTVWKWDTTNLGWQFYAPSMDAPTLQTYATSKGYGVLSVINPGEGFWVNAKQAFAKPLPSGEAVIAVSFQEGQPGALKQGWNLISVGNSRTPSSFNGAMSAVVPAGGVIPINITTLWAWDNPLGRWYFYAPNLEAQGGSVLTDYITAKGYLDFTANSKILGPGVGFWVNKP